MLPLPHRLTPGQTSRRRRRSMSCLCLRSDARPRSSACSARLRLRAARSRASTSPGSFIPGWSGTRHLPPREIALIRLLRHALSGRSSSSPAGCSLPASPTRSRPRRSSRRPSTTRLRSWASARCVPFLPRHLQSDELALLTVQPCGPCTLVFDRKGDQAGIQEAVAQVVRPSLPPCC